MSASFCYRAHGLTVDSEIALPELERVEGTPDVTIRYGSVPAHLSGAVRRGRRYEATDGQYLLSLPRVARYWVKDGREVLVAPVDGASDEQVRAFVLSSVFAALTHQIGVLVLHASAVVATGGAVLFAGKSGSGKSTLAAAFHARGYRVLADDIAAIVFGSDAAPLVHSGARHLKLRSDSLMSLGATSARARDAHGKYAVDVADQPSGGPLRIDRIFILSNQPAATIEVQPLTGRSRVAAVANQTFRRPMAVALGQGGALFARVVALCRHVPVVSLRRPAAIECLPTLVARIDDHLRAPASLDGA